MAKKEEFSLKINPSLEGKPEEIKKIKARIDGLVDIKNHLESEGVRLVFDILSSLFVVKNGRRYPINELTLPHPDEPRKIYNIQNKVYDPNLSESNKAGLYDCVCAEVQRLQNFLYR